MKAKLNQGILDTYKAINLFGSNYTLKAKSSAFRKPQESPHKPEVLCSKIIEPLFLSKWKRKAKVWCKWQIRPRSNEKKHGYSAYVREEASHWKTGQLSYIKKRKNEKRKTPLWPQWCENRWSVTESSSFCSVYAHGHAHTCAHTHSLLELPRTSFSSVMTCSKQPYLIPRKRAPATALAYSSMAFKHILSFLSSTLAQDEGHCPGGSLPALFASLSPRFFEACPRSIWAAQPCPPGESRSCRERQNVREGTGHGL